MSPRRGRRSSRTKHPLNSLLVSHRKMENRLHGLEHVLHLVEKGEWNSRVYHALRYMASLLAGEWQAHSEVEDRVILHPILVSPKAPPELKETAQKLLDEHHTHKPLITRFLETVQPLLEENVAPNPEVNKDLARLIKSLLAIYPPHIRQEDQVLLPFVNTIYSPEELLEVGKEIEAAFR